MKTIIQITQIVFNILTLEWELHLHIRGNTTVIPIPATKAESLINDINQGDTDRICIETTKDFVYYIPKG